MPVECRLSCGRSRAIRDRQRVSAGARASPSWIGGGAVPPALHYAFTERVCKLTDIGENAHVKWMAGALQILEGEEYGAAADADAAAVKTARLSCFITRSQWPM